MINSSNSWQLILNQIVDDMELKLFIEISNICSRNYCVFIVYALQPYLAGKIFILSCLKKIIKIGIS